MNTGAVLVLSEVFPPRTGGSGRWLWEIYRRQPRGQYIIAAGAHPNAQEFDRTHDLPITRLPLSFFGQGLASRKGLIGFAGALRRLHAMVQDHGITAIHCGRCLPEGLLALMFRLVYGIPYLCYVHGEDLGIASASGELRLLMQWVLRSASMLVVNSRNTAQIAGQEWNVPAERIAQLYPGVDTQRFVPARRDPQQRRPVLLTVGRLQKRKGHDQMLHALRRIQASVPDVLYVIVGDGEERAALETLTDRLILREHVRFVREVDDDQLVGCYQQCDLFVLPNRQVGSDFEGFGMVLLEAQACGKPVIAGASGGTRETMHVPETGRVVPCEGPDELAELVIELLRDGDQRAQMGASARRWVEERFDWSPLSRQAEQIFLRSVAAGVYPTALVSV